MVAIRTKSSLVAKTGYSIKRLYYLILIEPGPSSVPQQRACANAGVQHCRSGFSWVRVPRNEPVHSERLTCHLSTSAKAAQGELSLVRRIRLVSFDPTKRSHVVMMNSMTMKPSNRSMASSDNNWDQRQLFFFFFYPTRFPQCEPHPRQHLLGCTPVVPQHGILDACGTGSAGGAARHSW